jgi:AcrR family transcriptional regulator
VGTRRGDDTREHILDVAEQLFGERGIANVSLREIRIAAGARNTTAVQFHFGDRDGLLEALAQRHVPRIGARQQELWYFVESDRAQNNARRLVEVLVRPGAEYLVLGPSERAWTKIMSELVAVPDMPLAEISSIAPGAGIDAGRLLLVEMTKTMSIRIARERLFVAAHMLVHLYADRARVAEDDTMKRKHVGDGTFIENLIDMIYGALFAPADDARMPLKNKKRG